MFGDVTHTFLSLSLSLIIIISVIAISRVSFKFHQVRRISSALDCWIDRLISQWRYCSRTEQWSNRISRFYAQPRNCGRYAFSLE